MESYIKTCMYCCAHLKDNSLNINWHSSVGTVRRLGWTTEVSEFDSPKQLSHEADHSPPSTANVKYMWRYTSMPHMPSSHREYSNTGTNFHFFIYDLWPTLSPNNGRKIWYHWIYMHYPLTIKHCNSVASTGKHTRIWQIQDRSCC
jgi:hypothetical protein